MEEKKFIEMDECELKAAMKYELDKEDDKIDNIYSHLKMLINCANEIIKENFRKLNALGVQIIARTPVIPEIEQEIESISNFLKNFENVKKYELLPYHPLGIEKTRALGSSKIPGFTIPSKELMKELEKYVFIR